MKLCISIVTGGGLLSLPTLMENKGEYVIVGCEIKN